MKSGGVFIFFLVCNCSSHSSAQAPAVTPNPLRRQYKEGEKLAYHMKGVNEAWHYEINANSLVKKDASGHFFEEYQWTHMTSGGQPVALAASTGDYRQRLSLDPEQIPSAPNLTNVDPKLIGPITDMMTARSSWPRESNLGKA